MSRTISQQNLGSSNVAIAAAKTLRSKCT